MATIPYSISSDSVKAIRAKNSGERRAPPRRATRQNVPRLLAACVRAATERSHSPSNSPLLPGKVLVHPELPFCEQDRKCCERRTHLLDLLIIAQTFLIKLARGALDVLRSRHRCSAGLPEEAQARHRCEHTRGRTACGVGGRAGSERSRTARNRSIQKCRLNGRSFRAC